MVRERMYSWLFSCYFLLSFWQGAPFQWCAIFHKTDMRFSRGIDSLKFYSSHSTTKGYQLPCKVYCSYCNTPIMDEGRNMCLIFPELIEIGPGEEEHKRRRKVFDVK